MKKQEDIVKHILGNDFFESLQKTEIFKRNTNTVLSSEEIAHAYRIVPKVVLKFLIENLKPMVIGELKHISLKPLGIDGELLVNKHANDVYSGDITEGYEKVYDYQFRSICGIGILLLSSFELYDVDNIQDNNQHVEKPFDYSKIDAIIEDKMYRNMMINEVVEKKISEREAIDRLVTKRLAEMFSKPEEPQIILLEEVTVSSEQSMAKKSTLKDFLEKKKKKRDQDIPFLKHEISCEDCGSVLYKKEAEVIKGCICFGFGPQDDKSLIKIQKNESNVTLKFNKNWDEEDISKMIFTIKKG
jgi:hypothetical protein